MQFKDTVNETTHSPLEMRCTIVARIEKEHSIVEGNRELIRSYEEKVKKVIEKVWE